MTVVITENCKHSLLQYGIIQPGQCGLQITFIRDVGESRFLLFAIKACETLHQFLVTRNNPDVLKFLLNNA